MWMCKLLWHFFESFGENESQLILTLMKLRDREWRVWWKKFMNVIKEDKLALQKYRNFT